MLFRSTVEISEKARHIAEWLGYMVNDDLKKSELTKLTKLINEADELIVKVCEREGN